MRGYLCLVILAAHFLFLNARSKSDNEDLGVRSNDIGDDFKPQSGDNIQQIDENYKEKKKTFDCTSSKVEDEKERSKKLQCNINDICVRKFIFNTVDQMRTLDICQQASECEVNGAKEDNKHKLGCTSCNIPAMGRGTRMFTCHCNHKDLDCTTRHFRNYILNFYKLTLRNSIKLWNESHSGNGQPKGSKELLGKDTLLCLFLLGVGLEVVVASVGLVVILLSNDQGGRDSAQRERAVEKAVEAVTLRGSRLSNNTQSKSDV